MSSDRISITTLSKKLGVTPRTIRFYEARGLFKLQRTGKSWRSYGEDDVRIIEEIIKFTRFGFTLTEIGVMQSWSQEKLASALAGRRDDLLAEIDDLTGIATEITEAIGAMHRNEPW